MYAMHTTSYNAARTFKLMRAYRAIYTKVSSGQEWDDPLEFVHETVSAALKSLAVLLIKNEWHQIAPERHPTYNDFDYDIIAFTDASAAGWGAIVHNNSLNTTYSYQQMWINQLGGFAKQKALTNAN